MKKISVFLMAAILIFSLAACGTTPQVSERDDAGTMESITERIEPEENLDDILTTPPENFALIAGGTFEMGSPDTEAWRSEDETQHTVTVSDFYMSIYEVTQEEYAEVIGNNPSSFSGDMLPVETVSWLDAIRYCNTRSEMEGLTPAYTISGQTVTWDRSADGYRLPTEAEWEYACRAGTTTPFNTETSISAEEANYYGHYPYEIEENYFSQGNLDTQPGEYRQTTVDAASFSPNRWGLYNMHGNVSEWVWDYYGAYSTEKQTDPTGPETGTLRVYRGGGWNDFAKNMRSAYRAAMAEEIQSQTGADLFEITLVSPYSTDYNTVLDEAQRDQNEQARPELATHVENMEEYNTILLGYPNWWASIPMPIASFLEEYDFSGKTIIPFCSHGGGRFGQSLTAIAKLVPNATMGEALSMHYSGGSSLPDDVTEWLITNGILE